MAMYHHILRPGDIACHGRQSVCHRLQRTRANPSYAVLGNTRSRARLYRCSDRVWRQTAMKRTFFGARARRLRLQWPVTDNRERNCGELLGGIQVGHPLLFRLSDGRRKGK